MTLPRPFSFLVLSLLLATEVSAQSATKFVVPGTAVTASTYDVTNGAVPANAVDGNLSTRWAGQGDGAFITFDLGATRDVRFIKLAWHQGTTRTTTFDVLASDSTSGPWTTLLNRVVSSGTTLDLETYDFADTNARYIRVVGHGNSSGNGWNSITEVELWGAAVSTNTGSQLPVPGSAVTASTYDVNNNAVPANAVDADLSTRWAGQGDGASITFDLGAAQTVQLIKIAWYQGTTRTTTFDVLASGSTSGPWTTLLAGVVSSGTTLNLETYDFADTSARYIRVVGHGNSSGNGWNSITEVELWGQTSTVGQVATPAFTPPPGTYTSAPTVSISTSTAGASIRYTTDGSTPSSTHGTLYGGPLTLGTTTTLRAIAYQSGLTPSSVRGGTYTVGTGGGLDPSLPPSGNFDLTHWKLTLPNASEISAATLSKGYELENTFFTDPVTGGMVFRCPNLGGTTTNSSYSRTELREMLAPTGSASAANNNWVLGTSSATARAAAGGVDGTLKATLTVDRVSTTGESAKVGRVIVGQIHGPISEPIRLYFHKRPADARGAIYFAHDTPDNETNTYHAIIGDPNNLNPANGVLLGETWSYEIKVVGRSMTVKVTPQGRATVTVTYTLESGYDDKGMYFKAGVYNQNNTGTSTDYVQATFSSVTHTHP